MCFGVVRSCFEPVGYSIWNGSFVSTGSMQAASTLTVPSLRIGIGTPSAK